MSETIINPTLGEESKSLLALSFVSLVFAETPRINEKNTMDFLPSPDPKISGKERKQVKITKETPGTPKNKEIPKTRKRRTEKETSLPLVPFFLKSLHIKFENH